GGYVLARDPAEIKLSEIFTVLEGQTLTVECVDNQRACENSSDCITRKLWKQMNDAMLGVLENQTLQDLVKMTEKERMNYQI
ncbi:MAG: Rrf2 family transcriptional regulator, partial [Phycisphaerae bacterium]